MLTKRQLLLWVILCLFTSTMAQKVLTGRVIDEESGDNIELSTVQLLRTDSTMVTSALTAANGNFTLSIPKEGRYLLKVTCMGYKLYMKEIIAGKKNHLSVGDIGLKSDEIMLEGAVINGTVPKVTAVDDTMMYNTSAYRIPEGSMLDELVKKLPGAQVDDDGKLTINGKEVKKVLVDGKEFFVRDMKTAMSSLPVSVIDKIKAYDEKSDQEKITGVDDGDDNMVLDVVIKKGMKHGSNLNANVGVGSHERFSEQLNIMKFSDRWRTTLLDNINNTAGGNAQGGLQTNRMAGLNLDYEVKKKIEININTRWNHSNSDAQTTQETENFVKTIGKFSNNTSSNLSRYNDWNADMQLQWQPDTLTKIMFRPSIRYDTNDYKGHSLSASYNVSPTDYGSDDALSDETIAKMAADGQMVNRRRNGSVSYGATSAMDGSLIVSRQLNAFGRSISMSLAGSYNKNDNNQLSLQDVELFRIKNAQGQDSTYNVNRYNIAPATNWSYRAQLTYTEPVIKNTFLQFSYQFQYRYSDSNRQTFDLSRFGEEVFGDFMPDYRSWDDYLDRLPDAYENYRSDNLSRHSTYRNFSHDLRLQLKIVRQKYNATIGVRYVPERSHFKRLYHDIYTDTIRNVANITPTLNFRYRLGKKCWLKMDYQGSSQQPSIEDLLDITDDSNPLNIRKGNPGLKPAFTHQFHLNYNNYFSRHRQTIVARINYSNTRNSISNRVTYDDNTGGRTMQPVNINGNWNAGAMFTFNTALDTLGRWDMNTYSTVRYDNYVEYLSMNKDDSEKNTTHSTNYFERLSGSYRNDWLELELRGQVNYTHTTNLLQPARNLDTWQFGYGTETNIRLPWNMTLITELDMNSRRGYANKSFNTNELIWNANISQTFLRKKQLTLALHFYDILKQRSTLRSTLSASQRNETQYNAITSYVMFNVIYRFKTMGKM